jgi:hypothetical protein
MFQKAITERWYCSKMRMAPPWSLPSADDDDVGVPGDVE